MAIIYLLTNTVNGKRYIGFTTKGLDRRWRTHCDKAHNGSNYHIHRSIRKYGESVFLREILEDVSDSVMLERERFWIKELTPEYNMTTGGEGAPGRVVTEKTRHLMSLAQSGSNNPNYGVSPSPEVRAKISNSLKGKIVSIETRRRLSDSLSGKVRKRGKNAPRYGMKHSDEAKAKIADRIRQHFQTNKIVWVNRDGTNKRIPTNQLQQFLEDGWLVGMFMHNKS